MRACRPTRTSGSAASFTAPDPAPRVAAWVQDHTLLRSPPWRVRAFGLYSSWSSAEGSRYELERAYPLR